MMINVCFVKEIVCCLIRLVLGPEYGTTKQAMKGCVEAADRLAEVHIAVKDRLINAVQVRVKEWKNENYKKQLVGGCRESKAYEDEFRRVRFYRCSLWMTVST